MVKRTKAKNLKSGQNPAAQGPRGLSSLRGYTYEDREADEALDDLSRRLHRRVNNPPIRPRTTAAHDNAAPPLRDPADRRTARFAVRLHPHLLGELARLARHQGWTTSQLAEKLLIDGVNRVLNAEFLDRIGRRR